LHGGGEGGAGLPAGGCEGRVIAAVGMAGPMPRFRGKELARKIALTKEIAAKISASLGDRHAAANGH
jgi:DNA-binding IclR family transcriptional regulator